MSTHEQITEKLNAAFALDHLDVINESGGHNVAPGSETHFKVVLVSASFEGMPRVARHRAVMGALEEELAGPVHALAVHPYTGAEWLARFGDAPMSPPCLGGKAHESGQTG